MSFFSKYFNIPTDSAGPAGPGPHAERESSQEMDAEMETTPRGSQTFRYDPSINVIDDNVFKATKRPRTEEGTQTIPGQQVAPPKLGKEATTGAIHRMKTRAMALSAEMQRVQREIQELHAEKAKMVEDFNQWAQNKEHQLLEQSNQRVEQRVEQMRQELLQQMEQQREAERSASQEPLHKMTEDLRNMKDMLARAENELAARERRLRDKEKTAHQGKSSADRQGSTEDINMDLETRKPPMTMRELMKKKRGVKGKSLMVDKSRSAPERSPFVQDEVTDHFRSEAEATAGDSDTGRKGVKKRLLREKKEANASKQRTKHLRIVQKLFRDTLDIEQDDDIINHDSAPSDAIALYHRGQGDGPNLKSLVFAMRSSADDLWNVECINLLWTKLRDTLKVDCDYSDAYWKDMITTKFLRLRSNWRNGQIKPDESDAEWEERMDGKNVARLKKSRKRSRRQTKYDNRIETAELVIKVKRLREDTDVQLWEWILNILRRLKTDGMSSEESDINGKDRVYRVKILPWRREGIAELMDIVDAERQEDVKAYRKQGAKPVRRLRDKEHLMISTRRHMDLLPRVLYEEEWLRKPENAVRVDVSKETFEWLNIITRGSK